VAPAVPADPDPERESEPRALRRLVRNLLENACRHGAGGPVSSGCERSTAEAADGVRLWVADRGPGVPKELAERVFEPFYRLPGREQSGSGLGLALVRQIAARHGGSVACRSREGGGSVFEVVLPAR
jgi:two-component system OmpR family sensor kinase